MEPVENKFDIKIEEKKLYEEYKLKLLELKKVEKEKEAVGQVFTKGLLPLYVLYIISLGPTNGNEIAHKIGERTNNLWVPSTGGIYPILRRYEKDKLITGIWDDSKKKIQKIYTITEDGLKEFEAKKKLLKKRIEEAMRVFEIIYGDIYND